MLIPPGKLCVSIIIDGDGLLTVHRKCIGVDLEDVPGRKLIKCFVNLEQTESRLALSYSDVTV